VKTSKITKPGPNAGFPQSGEPESYRSEAIRELIEIKDGELPLKTETPPRLVVPFTLLETVEKGMVLRKKGEPVRRLSEIYREAFDRRMISKSRQGRKELIAALTAEKGKDGEEELRL